MRGEWTQTQIDRVQHPVYAAKAERARRAHRAARFDGRAEYTLVRRIQRADAKSVIFHIRFLEER